MKELYGMELHDTHTILLPVVGKVDIMRVPGGWVYVMLLDSESAATQFVPFDNEFQQEANNGRCGPCNLPAGHGMPRPAPNPTGR